MTRTPLDDDAIRQQLKSLPNWALHDGRLQRSYKFQNFKDAFMFMTRIAFEAERMDHHPAWRNVYASVDVELWTHDVGGVSVLDIALAQEMERQFSRLAH